MPTCFKCAGPNGFPRRSHAMRRDWYETREDPARTINECGACYEPDPLAGKRTEAAWEAQERIWGEREIPTYELMARNTIRNSLDTIDPLKGVVQQWL